MSAQDDAAASTSASDLVKHMAYLERALNAPEGTIGALLLDSDWSLVIKCHALVEGAVSYMLATMLDDRLRPVFARLELSREDTGKLAFAKSLNSMTAGQRRFVRALSELRNVIAHDIRHVGFTIATHVAALDNQQKRSFEDAVCFDLAESNRAVWISLFRSDPRAAVLTAAVRLLVQTVLQGDIAKAARIEASARAVAAPYTRKPLPE